MSSEPWLAACAGLQALLRDRLPDVHVAVRPLGLRDELAADGAADAVFVAAEGALSVPVFLDGRQVVVGPWPSRSGPGCPRCLARRWQLVRPPQVRDAWEQGGSTAPAGAPPLLPELFADVVAALVEHQKTADRTPAGVYDVYRVRLADLRVRRVRLIADPDCPVCARPQPDRPWVPDLTGAVKPDPDTFRAHDARSLDVPMDALVNELCGALGPGSLPELGLPTTSAVFGSVNERCGAEDRYEIFWGGHCDTYAGSLRVGVLEGLERQSGVRPRGRRLTVIASYDELVRAGEPVLDPHACGVYSDDFYRAGTKARPFDPSRPIRWAWGWSLRDHGPLLVPEALAYYHSVPEAERFVQECSNGCASGSSFVEAALFGLLEVVERDAFLLAWYGRAALPEIDPRTSSRPRIRRMVDRLAMYGYRARFFDTRMSFPIPVVTAVAQRLDGGVGALCFGAGAGLDPEQAMDAALSEIATDSLFARRRVEWDLADLQPMAGDFDRVLRLHDHPQLYGLPEMTHHADFLLADPHAPAPRPVREVFGPGPYGAADLKTDLDRCLAPVVAAGFDVIAIDQTHPEQRRLGLSTVRVMVPGLLPIDFGWRRQRALLMPRLRTAQREAGRLDRDLVAADLNPAPHPFP
jgi:ribosomal protein S12 methylthiotransferase accessory factor